MKPRHLSIASYVNRLTDLLHLVDKIAQAYDGEKAVTSQYVGGKG